MSVALVIDNGSATLKAGFAGHDGPTIAVPSIVGRPRHPGSSDACFIGFEAQEKRGVLSLRRPVERGVVSDWDDMERLWSHVFRDELRVDPENHSVLLADVALNAKIDREKAAEVFFETFQSPALYLQNQQVLALYASGRTSGLVVDCGDGSSLAVPVYEGYSLPHAVQTLPLGGRDLTVYLAGLLSGRCVTETEVVRHVKEKLCFVSSAEGEASEKSYELPCGQVIRVGEERWQCPEVLFKPSLVGLADGGVHDLVYNAIMKSNVDIRKDMFSAIVLSGGSTMFSGFSERLKKKLCKISPPSTRIRIIAPPERKYAAWIGGSILASIPTFQQMYVSKAEYEESGAIIIHKKCV